MSDYTTNDVSFLNERINNNPALKESYFNILTFNNYLDLEAINTVFPFLESYDSEYILLEYEELNRHSNDNEYRKAVFCNLGKWQSKVFNIYSGLDTYELVQERIAIFTSAREAAIAKIQIIRNTTVSSNISKVEESSKALESLEMQLIKALKEIELLKQENTTLKNSYYSMLNSLLEESGINI